MQQYAFSLRFDTPAFLGNAEQSGQWRTPPIKALLRQWWRVAYFADHRDRFDLAAMRREEGVLFGNAWLSHREGNRDVTDHSKSQVRIRLDLPESQSGNAWEPGSQQGVAPLPTNLSTSYAWFGLVDRGAGLPDRTGIKADETEGVRVLRLAAPEQYLPQIENAVTLINSFGQIGARSRGGWGSFHIVGAKALTAGELARYTLPLSECLKDDWPKSLGRDDTGRLLLWESRSSYPSWDRAMRTVAAERRNVRTALKSVGGDDLRIALGFAGQGRMPSPLRWKLVPREHGQLAVRVFAMPHGIPADSGEALSAERLKRAWSVVCQTLDGSTTFLPRTMIARTNNG